MQGRLVHRHLVGQDPANLSELWHRESVRVQSRLHRGDLLVREGDLAVEILDLRRDPQAVEEEGERVDAEDHAGHVLAVVDVRRLRREDLRQEFEKKEIELNQLFGNDERQIGFRKE